MECNLRRRKQIKEETRESTLRVREISGAGKSARHVWGAPHVGASNGKHLHRGIDLRSYDSESTRSDENSGVGVPGVAGADARGVPDSDSAIFPSRLPLDFLLPFFLFFLNYIGGYLYMIWYWRKDTITWFSNFYNGWSTEACFEFRPAQKPPKGFRLNSWKKTKQ